MSVRLATYTYDRDPETGRVKIVRSYHVDNEDEIESAGDALAQGYFPTGERHGGNWDPQDITQGFQVDVHYEGVSVGYRDALEKALWRFHPHWEKEPIEKHPRVSYLIENYGGQEDGETGRVTFRRFLNRNQPSGGGLMPPNPGVSVAGAGQDTAANVSATAGASSGNQIKNPAYGLNESGWLSMQGIAIARFTSTSASHLDGVGELLDALPGNAPDFGIDEDRNWIKAPPLVDEIPQPADEPRLYEIELQFMLSPRGGWPPAVYNFIDV